MNRNLFELVAGIIVGLLLSPAEAFSQEMVANVPRQTPPSPNAASLGTYGQIPVSIFNGLPEITIPIGNITLDEASVDLSINYHGGGIHPDHHPGWVGLGWDLNAGGVITRQVNGGTDEILTPGFTPETIFGYYYNYAEGNRSDWYTPNNLTRYFSTSQNLVAYPAPDEFMFNFGKYSGSFYLDHTGKWQVKSESPLHLKVQEELQDRFVLQGQPTALNITIRRLFYKFTLTTPDGTQYIFGGNPTAIEFTRNADITTDDPYHNGIIPTSWYLTKIITKYGREINFRYERDGVIALQTSNVLIYEYHAGSSTSGKVQSPSGKGISIVNPFYLTEIITPNQKVEFSRSNSNELAYSYDGSLLAKAMYADLSESPTGAGITEHIKWRKLDSIAFYTDAGKFLKKIAFSYKEQPDSRLMLTRLQETGIAGSSKMPYRFSYNESELPNYNAQMLDHWGFYNGRNFFSEHPFGYTYTKNDVPAYADSRAYNATLMQGGILTAIKYPTGGSTNFEYEPHEYAMIAKRFPFTIDNVANTKCGGLRVKKISDIDGLSNTQNSREFLYVRNYNSGGTTSSGILSGVPQYLDEGQLYYTTGNGTGTLDYWYWFDYSIEPLSFTGGNHVTYSEVVEKLPDGSYAIHNFSNHDSTQYRELPPLGAITSVGHQWKIHPNTSLSLDRGKLLEKRDFKANGILIRDIKYKYDESAARHNEVVRIISMKTRIFGDDLARDEMGTAYLIYTFPRFLTKTTETIWDQNGNNPLTTERNYTFNNYRLPATESFTNSNGQAKTTYYRYPFDVYADPVSGMPDNQLRLPFMISRNMINYPCEVLQTSKKDNVEMVINGKVTMFGMLNNTVKPEKEYLFRTNAPVNKNNYINYTVSGYNGDIEINQLDPHLEKRVEYILNDNLGNIQQYSKDNDTMSFIWGYNDHYLIAEAPGQSLYSIAYTSFETTTEDKWVIPSSSRNSAEALTGRQSFDMSNAGSTGITITGFSGKHILSYWTKNATPITVTGMQGSPVKGETINGWTLYEHIISGASQVKITGAGLIDELRFYPLESQMTTYTHDPLIGLTSQCNAQNRITFYEYDGLGRLRLVKDQHKKILKIYCYTYYGQLTECSDTVYQNAAKSKTFYKNNCSPDFTGGSAVTYTVPAERYKAGSPEEAEALAQADIDANGQTHANANGTCLCNGRDKKLIGNRCETGTRVNDSSSPVSGGYKCVYHYEWSDGSVSQQYSETNSSPCPIE